MTDVTPSILTDWCRTLVPSYDPWASAGDGHYFDVAEAVRVVAFVHECLTFTEAEWAGRPFVLQPWQAAMIGNLFGWKRADATRRYRKALLFTPRKAGKSEMAAAIALILLFIDGETSPKIVSAAANAEQAHYVFGAAQKMVEAEPELSRRAEVMTRAIRVPASSGNYKVVNAAANTKHGGNLHAAIIDELHAIGKPALVDALTTSMGSRRQPLVLYTTTAGDDPHGVCAEVHDYALKVRSGIVADPEFLPVVYQAEQDDDYGSVETWQKAQPNLGVTVPVEVYQQEYAEALAVPRKMTTFRQLRLNQFVSGASAWLDHDRWMSCPPRVPVDELAGREAYGGLDVSAWSDFTAFTLQFPSERLDGKHDHDVLSWYWLPEDRVVEAEKATGMPLRAWADDPANNFDLTPGDYIDPDRLWKRVVEIAEAYNVREVAYDPAYARLLAVHLQDAGLDVFEFWSRATMYNPVLRYLEAAVIDGRLRHGSNPIMNWMSSNVRVHKNADGLIRPEKPKGPAKIDGVVALAMAMGAHCKQGEAVDNGYDELPMLIL